MLEFAKTAHLCHLQHQEARSNVREVGKFQVTVMQKPAGEMLCLLSWLYLQSSLDVVSRKTW